MSNKKKQWKINVETWIKWNKIYVVISDSLFEKKTKTEYAFLKKSIQRSWDIFKLQAEHFSSHRSFAYVITFLMSAPVSASGSYSTVHHSFSAMPASDGSTS